MSLYPELVAMRLQRTPFGWPDTFNPSVLGTAITPDLKSLKLPLPIYQLFKKVLKLIGLAYPNDIRQLLFM